MKVFRRIAVSAAALIPLVALAVPGSLGGRAQAADATAGDPVRGARLFLQCQACHTVTSGGANTVGPNLAGVMGARAAGKAGYRYSPALVRAGLTWTPANMDRWLVRPTAMVPGTTMAFAGVANPKNRADLVAYLGTLKKRR